jgi:iron complex outermembrane receptor protein
MGAGRLVACAAVAAGALLGVQAKAQSVEDMQHMSIGDLANIDVSSVTKTPQALSQAPAAIYVITHDDIVRSGATSVPEMLRLAPNLEVEQTTASHYTITARGFNGNAADQNFSDKLLILIDGRSVYNPLFSGVYWDLQDVVPQDIDRIEVISGPGATLWGANAVNGVINIITRKSGETQGGLVAVDAGTLESSVSVRYGGRINDNLTYRLYVRDIIDNDTVTSIGANAHDHGSKPQGGFRFDWTPSDADAVTLQGDAFEGSEAQLGAPNEDIEGRNLVARWNHSWSNGAGLQVQAYYDQMGRSTEHGGGSFTVDTYDLDVQHSFSLNARNDFVWGGGVRHSHYNIAGTASLQFAPATGDLNLVNLFVQDTISISQAVKLTVGLKLEDDPYSGLSPLPSARVSWQPNTSTLLWAAVSRAIRSPTPFDRDVVEKVGSTVFLTGGANFQSETLTAYEIGARVQPTSRLSFSVSTFYNTYDELRSIEPQSSTVFLPLKWGNGLRGETYGLEAWGDYRVSDWWRMSAGFNALYEHFSFRPGASGLLGVDQLGDDPHYQASLRSSMNLGHAVTLDADLRYVDALPNPSVPAYVELNARIGWKVSDHVQLSLSGFNLLHDRHQELPAAGANAVPRSASVGLQWAF